MEEPRTLLSMAGVNLEATRLCESVLVIIDAQREYLDGKLRLQGIDESIKEAATLLERARKAGTPVIHVVHLAKPGSSLFNPESRYVDIVGPLSPRENETVVTKSLPNSFAGTELAEALTRCERKDLIVIGYMTHMCVSTTVRAALDLGYRSTVVARATATRDLPAPGGGVVPAHVLQASTLAALADRFAAVVLRAADIPE